ncbi:MAG: ABC transporter ATP-binding protein [Tissierellia bacterium]|nr:ABC transporter ATP-binding protein [Tissierellia bacterium]
MKNKSPWEVCKELYRLVSSLKKVLVLAILTGAIGHIAATMIPTLGAIGLIHIIEGKNSLKIIGIILVLLAISRSLLRYVEQLANHYVAFKTLQIIRDKVFQALRTLAPAKLEAKNKGELISFITSDIELLEVFYAHTISPVGIAMIHTMFSVIFLSLYHIDYGILLLLFHLVMAIFVPIITSKRAKNIGDQQRKDLSKLNSLILDTFTGIKECIQYHYGKKRWEEVREGSGKLSISSKTLSDIFGENQGISTATVLLGNIFFFILSYYLYTNGKVGIRGIIIPITYFMSSFGPVIALSNLANNLLLTFACGRRILGLLEEKPEVEEITGKEDIDFRTLEVKDLSFAYQDENIFEDVHLKLDKGEILGVSGKSGSGKSTLLKQIMHFYPVKEGHILLNQKDINEINSSSLRENQCYLTQDIYLFQGNILENIKLGKPHATMDEVIEAAKKASVHSFIESLPEGYFTKIDYVKNSLSTGEMQRISLARAFLQGGKLMVLDEPTSNIDSLNEGIILKALFHESKDKGMIIVSHKKSTLRIADKIMEIKRDRSS